MIRVCLVEDQTLVREGLRTLLEMVTDIEVVAEAVDGEEAIRVIPVHALDVVLLDMRLPKRSGLEVLRALAEIGALPPTIILTTFDEDALVLDGVRAGARGTCSRMSRSTSSPARSARSPPGGRRSSPRSPLVSPTGWDGFASPSRASIIPTP